jgi:hypothetical protein
MTKTVIVSIFKYSQNTQSDFSIKAHGQLYDILVDEGTLVTRLLLW